MPKDDLRAIFDEDPELYDRARPGYPSELVDDLFALGDLCGGARIAEIGAETGQATSALAGRGAHVVAVEMGPALAAVLQRNSANTSVDVVVSAFEDWHLPRRQFDALVAFTAWHWLDPAVRTGKAAAALGPGGVLATVTTVHVAGGSSTFFADVQGCYERWDPSTPVGLRLAAAADVPPDLDEVDGSPLFAPAARRRYQQEIDYSTRDYLALLATYSGHRALADEPRRRLFGCIADLIDRGHGGKITKCYLYELRVARKHLPR